MLLMWQALGVACTGQSRLLVWPRRAPMGVPEQISRCDFFFSAAPGRLPCLAGLALSLRRRHRQQRLACIARRWGWCSACMDGATGRTAREWCSACVVRLDRSLLEQRRPDPHAISVVERAQAGLARRRFPVLHTQNA